MSSHESPKLTTQLSVVIPSYNSAPWLPSTLHALGEALARTHVGAEVIVVDDGSTDGTSSLVKQLAAGYPADLRVVVQENLGRFLARWNGIQRARSEWVLLLDSRVLIDRDSLANVRASLADAPERRAWNGYVVTDPTVPLVGLFWEVPTHVFWGRFLRRPVPYDLTSQTFDTAPKGTGLFLATRSVLIESFRSAWPTEDARLVSDDTKILRFIADQYSIRLEPRFSATYRPRTTVRDFVGHTLDRGTLFVDSYAGTTAVRSTLLIALAVAPVLAIVLLGGLIAVGQSAVAIGLVVAMVLLALAPVVPAAINGCSPRGIVAYIACLPLFVVPFWLGLVRGVFIHRRAFARTRRKEHA